MNIDKKNSKDFLQGYFLLPSWWIDAFESSLSMEPGSFESSAISLLFPTLTLEELNALLNILSLVRQNLLGSIFPKAFSAYNQDLSIDLDLTKYRKNFTSRQTQFFSYDRVAQFFCNLMLLSSSISQDSSTSFKYQRIIKDFSFIKNNSDISLKLYLDDTSKQICLGYFNPYKFILNQSVYLPSNLNPSILVLSSSWEDLTVLEQMLLLVLKKSMYWDRSWLHFDGIFGTDFSKILSLLSLNSSKSKLKSTSKPLDFINRFTKKLLEHGCLTKPTPSYLAFDGRPGSNLFIWQASSKELALLSDSSLVTTCNRFVSTYTRSEFTTLLKILSCDSVSSQISFKISKFYESIYDHSTQFFTPILDKYTNSSISTIMLFIEWCLRSSKDHPFSLSSVIKQSSLSSICSLKSLTREDNLDSLIQSFFDLMHNQKLYSFIQNQPFSSLAMSSSRNSKEVLDYLSRFKVSSSYSIQKEVPTTGKENLPTIPSFDSTPKDLVTKEISIAQSNTVKLTPNVKHIIPKLEQSLPTKSFLSLKKIALEELNSLKSKNPEKYNLLKQSYLDSLSEEKRQILLAVHDRVEEEVFDSQLKHGLLKYMIDNPKAWSWSKNS